MAIRRGSNRHQSRDPNRLGYGPSSLPTVSPPGLGKNKNGELVTINHVAGRTGKIVVPNTVIRAYTLEIPKLHPVGGLFMVIPGQEERNRRETYYFTLSPEMTGSEEEVIALDGLNGYLNDYDGQQDSAMIKSAIHGQPVRPNVTI